VSAKPEAAGDAPAPAKSKKLLMIIIGLVVVVVLGAVGAFVVISKQRAAADDPDAEAHPPSKAAVSHAAPKTPPVYLPLDSMVVNLADPGGERVAQVGITLEVLDAKSSDAVKAFLPTIRSGILLLVSQRTAEELLNPEGKQKLASDILRETSIPFGGGEDDDHEEESTKPKKKKRAKVHVDYPVVAVLFSSFIVQ
jgi:flagellar FliL protein